MRKRIAALEPYDSETGQPLFSPVTNQSRSPSLLNRSTSRSSVERLSKPKASKQSVINYRQAKANPNSRKILEKAQHTKIKGIFESLEPSGDGFITQKAIELLENKCLNRPSVESSEQLKILKPVLESIEDQMDFDSFHEAILHLLPSLNPGQKASIFRPKLLAPPSPSRSPTIRKSLQKDDSDKIFERLQEYKSSTTQKQQIRRSEELQRKMQE